MPDTRNADVDTPAGACPLVRPHCTALITALLAAVAIAVIPASVRAGPVNATVVWIRGDRVYLASRDSIALEPGDRLTFVYRKRPLAWGEVSNVYDDAFAAARITSGSLAKAKHLDRIEVLSERPPLRAPPMLRVGFPSRNRPSLVFACDTWAIRAPPSAATYRAETIAANTVRMIRDSTSAPDAPWPDTLIARAFDDATDEEIALERGELDVAVFWPGEPSSRLRDDPRWEIGAEAPRTRGVIAGIATNATADSSGDFAASAEIARLNDRVFRGDLVPWARVVSRQPIADSAGASHRDEAWSVEVDDAWPGRRVIRGLFGRDTAPPGRATRTMRLSYRDVPIISADSLRESKATPLFAIRCPTFFRPELRNVIRALGANTLADMLECAPLGRRP